MDGDEKGVRMTGHEEEISVEMKRSLKDTRVVTSSPPAALMQKINKRQKQISGVNPSHCFIINQRSVQLEEAARKTFLLKLSV